MKKKKEVLCRFKTGLREEVAVVMIGPHPVIDESGPNNVLEGSTGGRELEQGEDRGELCRPYHKEDSHTE